MAIIFVESIDREEGAILDAATFRPFFLVFKSSASMVPSFFFLFFFALHFEGLGAGSRAKRTLSLTALPTKIRLPVHGLISASISSKLKSESQEDLIGFE